MALKDEVLFTFMFFFSALFIGRSIYAYDARSTVGVHLGTTYSSMGIYRNGKVEIVANDQGNQMTPSGVSLADKELLIGEAAKNESNLKPTYAIFYAKRLIGRKFDDLEVQREMSVSPYKIIDKDSKPHIEVKMRDGEILVLSPEEIIAMVLRRMKETAEAYLGEKIKRVVITIPVTFDNEQTKAIEEACAIAGLDLERTFKEPVAAVVAYGLYKEEPKEKNILVFNLGNSTCEVSILNMDETVISILATSRDIHFGGEDFDHRVLEYFIKLIMRNYHRDISQDKATRQKVLRECGKAKMALGCQHQVLVDIESLIDGVDFSVSLTSLRFEELNTDLLNKIKLLVKEVLDGANLKRSDICEMVLVGGGTQIPTVRKTLKDFFYGKEPLDHVSPDEVLTHGAAIWGSTIEEIDSEQRELLPSIGLYPVSVGIGTVGGVMTKVIPRDAIFPIRKSMIFTTYQDNQTTVTINVYEGERELAKDCRELGSFSLSGIAPAPRGVPQIEVSFDLDHNGMLHVMAVDKSTRTVKSNKIPSNPNRNIGWNEIQRDIMEAEKSATKDLKTMKRIEARKKLETYFKVKSSINGVDYLTSKIEVEDKESLRNALNDVMEWLDELEKKTRDWEIVLGPVCGEN